MALSALTAAARNAISSSPASPLALAFVASPSLRTSSTPSNNSALIIEPRRYIHVPKWRWGIPPPKIKRGERFGRQWRARQGLPNVLEETGPLAELPDWSYADDGRPGPLSIKQTEKVLEQQRLSREVLSGLQFIKFLKERPEKHKKEEEAKRADVIRTKLKPKGQKFTAKARIE